MCAERAALETTTAIHEGVTMGSFQSLISLLFALLMGGARINSHLTPSGMSLNLADHEIFPGQEQGQEKKKRKISDWNEYIVLKLMCFLTSCLNLTSMKC